VVSLWEIFFYGDIKTVLAELKVSRPQLIGSKKEMLPAKKLYKDQIHFNILSTFITDFKLCLALTSVLKYYLLFTKLMLISIN